ncbi:MAG: hypothetical protein ACP5E2_16410, partial [Terracidiphilus sp.]
LPDRRRLELSLSQKNGRLNEDFYLDHYQKLEQFLKRYFSAIEHLALHDGTTVTLDSKISLVPSFQLSKRTYIFAGDKEARNQFFGLRDNPPLKLADPNTKLEFVFLPIDRSKSPPVAGRWTSCAARGGSRPASTHCGPGLMLPSAP